MMAIELDVDEHAICLEQGIAAANFFGDLSPLDLFCPLTFRGAKSLAEKAGIESGKIEAAAFEIIAYASERWEQIRANHARDEKR